jgi:hypothetical protein
MRLLDPAGGRVFFEPAISPGLYLHLRPRKARSALPFSWGWPITKCFAHRSIVKWSAQPAGITVAKSSGDDKRIESLMEHHGAGTRVTAGGEVETNKLLASGTGCTV